MGLYSSEHALAGLLSIAIPLCVYVSGCGKDDAAPVQPTGNDGSAPGTSDSATNTNDGTTPNPGDGAGGGGSPDVGPSGTGGEDAAGGDATVCSRVVPESVSPTISCVSPPVGAEYDGCSQANKACGPVYGCVTERNETVESVIQTEYTPPPSGYQPPTTLLPAMGTTITGTGSGWFGRGDGTEATGSCGLPPLRNIMAAALTARQFGNADWCGACAEVVGRAGTRVRITIVDQCAGCADGGLDIASGDDSPMRMLNVEGHPDTCRTGRMPIAWKIVPCETSGGIVVHYRRGYNRWTPAVQIRNHRLPLAKLEDYVGDAWVNIQRQANNVYRLAARSSNEAVPIRLRITAMDGSQITGTFPAYDAEKSYEASSQF